MKALKPKRLLTVIALVGTVALALAAVYSYRCPKCNLIQQYSQPGVYKCPKDGLSLIPQ
jgi:hypothetical protein